MNEQIQEVELDKMVEEAKKEVGVTPEDILNEKRKEQAIINKARQDNVNLGQLGNFKKVTKEEADNVFEHLPETIFQIHKCLFRVSYIHDSKHKFTAELINLEETTK